MKIAIVTFEGFNEIDSFVALHLLNRMSARGWLAEIVAPQREISSMNGVTVQARHPLSYANEADVVLFGSGRLTRGFADDGGLMSAFRLDPARQLIGAQCSGVLMLHRLGLTNDVPLCTDATTRPWLLAQGAQLLERPFHAVGNIATAGGCLASTYLAAWVIHRHLGIPAVAEAIGKIAPVGEVDTTLARVLSALGLA